MKTKIKLKLKAEELKIVRDFLLFSHTIIKVENIASLVVVEVVEYLIERFNALKYTQRKSYIFNLDITTANALCCIFYMMKNLGGYEKVIALEHLQDIEKQIERRIHVRKYSNEN